MRLFFRTFAALGYLFLSQISHAKAAAMGFLQKKGPADLRGSSAGPFKNRVGYAPLSEPFNVNGP